MDVINLVGKDGPSWVFAVTLLMVLLYLVRFILNRMMSVIDGNTQAIAKFTEIVSHCQKLKKTEEL
jgi:hypothetical protein